MVRPKGGGPVQTDEWVEVRSLDDFARAFFGVSDGSYVPQTYTFADVTKALNDVVADDWHLSSRRLVQ